MYLFLFLGGVIVGGLLDQVPARLVPVQPAVLPRKEFIRAYPRNSWITLAFPILYFANFFFVGITFLLVCSRYYPANSKWFVFLFPLTVIVGTSLPTALFELLSRVSPKFHNRSSFWYLVHPNFYYCGIFRLVLILMVAGSAYYLCVFPFR